MLIESMTHTMKSFASLARDGHFQPVECNSASAGGEQNMKRVKELFQDIKWFAVALYAAAFVRDGADAPVESGGVKELGVRSEGVRSGGVNSPTHPLTHSPTDNSTLNTEGGAA